MREDQDNTILTVSGLKTHFAVRRGIFGRRGSVRAVNGVNFSIRRGRTLGLVGESGSGKTTVGRTVLNLIPATAGSVNFDGRDVFTLGSSAMRALRRRMQMIFQDPFSSLDPRMTVGGIIAEPLAIHTDLSRRQRRIAVGEMLERVGLSAGYANRYPHEFSGGQRQRVGIARALASNPDFIVCDEPVSALDVSIQAQILNLLSDLQDQMKLTYLFIAHNLAVVEHFADEVAVMYLGRIVETAPSEALYARPTHPYTESLLAAVPKPEPVRIKSRIRLPGEVPSAVNPPSGCPFHPRCPLTRKLAEGLGRSLTATITSDGEPVTIVARCASEAPSLKPVADNPAHLHACLLRQQNSAI